MGRWTWVDGRRRVDVRWWGWADGRGLVGVERLE